MFPVLLKLTAVKLYVVSEVQNDVFVFVLLVCQFSLQIHTSAKAVPLIQDTQTTELDENCLAA